MSIFGNLFGGGDDAPPPPVAPTAPAPPPAFGVQPQGKKPTAKPMSQTFLGAEQAAGASQTGQKTLLGT